MNEAKIHLRISQQAQFLKVNKLIKDGFAGLNKEGKIVDIRENPEAARIGLSDTRAKNLLREIVALKKQRAGLDDQ